MREPPTTDIAMTLAVEDTIPGLTQTTSPLALRELAADSRAMNEAEFAARYGKGFLLHQGPLESLGRLARAQATLISTTRRHDLLEDHEPLPFVIYALRRTGRSPFPNYV